MLPALLKCSITFYTAKIIYESYVYKHGMIIIYENLESYLSKKLLSQLVYDSSLNYDCSMISKLITFLIRQLLVRY